MNGFLQNFLDNPILTRELRRRMRGKALIFSICGYIIIMTITSIMILLTGMNPFDQFGAQNNTKLLEDMVKTGTLLFNAISVIQALLVLIIAPTITAGMTTMEKEKQTFDFLRVTTITPWMYVIGCFLSTIFYVSLALLCALPLISLSFLYGGVSREDVISRTISLLALSMVLSAMGLFISSIRERTRTAQGIVVFLIFIMLFGAIVIESSLSVQFGSGLFSGGGAPIVTLAGLNLTKDAMVWLSLFMVSLVLLLMATRKLFDPYESRAVNHWQFSVIFGAMITITLVACAQTMNDTQGIFVTVVGCFMLGFAAHNFAVGRMEVGDEMWHMKRLFPLLRPFDQTVPFIILVGLVWYWAMGSVVTNLPGGHTLTSADALISAALLSLAGYFFFCCFARYATAVSVGRRQAGNLTLGVIIGCWLVLPIVGGILSGLMQDTSFDSSPFQFFFLQLYQFSPVFFLSDSFLRNDEVLNVLGTPVGLGCAFYISMGLLFLALGEPLRYKRWKGFSWHYDMPSR
jgi:hypothetical protein